MARTPGGPPAPVDGRTLALATAVALLIATMALGVYILPANYGVDPVGLGGALGIDEPAPGPATDGPPPPRELTLLVGANRTLSYPLRLAEGQSVDLVWNSTAPMIGNWTGQDANGTVRPLEITWSGNATWQSASFVVPFTGKYSMTWHNPGSEPVHVRFKIAFDH